MELEEGKIYTTQQMQKFMGISKSTWDHRRDELLENFCLYYEYEVVYEGRSTKYHIIRKLGDYQKPLSKRSKELRDQIYEKEIVDVIERDNVQTAKNIARIIQKKDEIQEYHHTEGTVYEYTRLRVASMFGKKVGEGGTHGEILEKIWCSADLEHNCYIPMSDEAIQKFYDCYSQSKEDGKQKELELLNDYQIGLIKKEELQEAIGEISLSNYIAARKCFYQKYGYYPIKVPVYGLDGFDILRFEKGWANNDQC